MTMVYTYIDLPVSVKESWHHENQLVEYANIRLHNIDYVISCYMLVEKSYGLSFCDADLLQACYSANFCTFE